MLNTTMHAVRLANMTQAHKTAYTGLSSTVKLSRLSLWDLASHWMMRRSV
jgi:hypothetical protein